MYIYPLTLPDSIQHYIDQLRSIFQKQLSYSVRVDDIAIPVDDPGVYLIPLHVTLAPTQIATQHMDVYLACQFSDTRDDTDTGTIPLNNVQLPTLPPKVAYQAIQYSDKYPDAPVVAIALDGDDVKPVNIAALVIEHAQQICQ